MNGRQRNALLIVDDDRPFGAMLGWAFEDLGYAVVLAGNCREALARFNDLRFDYALLDFGLPDGDGHALSRRLAAQQPGVSVVMMSADRDGALASIGEAPEAFALLHKPFSPKQADMLFRAGLPGDRFAVQA